MRIYSYGLCIGIGLAAYLAASLLLCRDKSLRKHLFCASGFGFVMGLILSRAVWCAANYSDYSWGPVSQMFDLTQGGGSIFAAFTGFAGAVFIYARLSSVSARSLFDATTPGLMLFTAIARGAEALTNGALGMGREISWQALAGTVFTLKGSWDEYRFAVYRFEYVLAAILFIIAVIMCLKRRKHVFSICFGALCAFQVVFESLRDDYHMNVHYVRISQVLAMMALLFICVYFTVHYIRSKGITGVLPLILTVLGIALCVKQEFTVDTALDVEVQYLIMLSGSLIAYAGGMWAMLAAPEAEAKPGMRLSVVLAVLTLAFTVLCPFAIRWSDWKTGFVLLYVVLAIISLALVIVRHCTFARGLGIYGTLPTANRECGGVTIAISAILMVCVILICLLMVSSGAFYYG